MDDFSKIQKINSIARELMHHGQATSMDEAMKLAIRQVDMPKPPMPEMSSGSDTQSFVLSQTDSIPHPPTTGSTQNNAVNVSQNVPNNNETQALDSNAFNVSNAQGSNTQESNTQEPHKEDVQEIVSRQRTIISRLTDTINLHSKQMQDMDDKINRLIAEFSSVKTELAKLKESPVAPPLNPKTVKTGQTQFKQESAPVQTVNSTVKKPSGNGHARTGNYKPDDVSIEKFFYFGHK